MGKLDGKVAFITGGARGQGRSHAVRLAEEGAQIVVTDIAAQVESVPYPMATPEDLQETVRLVEELDQPCIAIQADARDPEAMKDAAGRAVSEFGHIDIALINHGVGTPAAWDADPQKISDILDINLKAALFACQAVIPPMIEQGTGGSIVITASVAGMRPVYGLTAYSMSKAGALALMRALSAELGPHDIRVNAICPGMVDTPMVNNDAMLSMFCGVETGGTMAGAEFAARNLNLLPKAWLEARDISNAVLWLVSDDARFVTGIEVPVDMGCANQPSGIPMETAGVLGHLMAQQQEA